MRKSAHFFVQQNGACIRTWRHNCDRRATSNYIITWNNFSPTCQECNYLHYVTPSGRGEFLFFGRTFDLISGKSINYACAVKNDTPIMCTMGLSADEIWALKRKSGDEVINEITMRYSDGYSDVSLRKLSGLSATSLHITILLSLSSPVSRVFTILTFYM